MKCITGNSNIFPLL